MGANLDVGNNPSRDYKAIDKRLADLYCRRSAVENLIRCLEGYAACQAKNERRERLKAG